MSAILSADDLNDFITPGAACIKPPAQNKNKENETEGYGEVEIQLNEDGSPLEISKIDGKQTTLSAAQVSLADCLACSGCITSAEEVLVAQHSHEELIKVMRENLEGRSNKIFVASISHQSRASLATAYNLSVSDIDRLLINLFVDQMGFKYIVGTSLGRKLSLIEEAKNMVEKKESNYEGPVLSSICPGWVLYAEKTHPFILDRLSEIKSPQQITGYILKTLTAEENGVSRDDIYHLSIMPCFDKKLESARPERDESPSDDVDCVLTPKELVTLLNQYPNDFQLIPENSNALLTQSVPLIDLYRTCAPKNWPLVDYSWSNDSGSASGGYGFNYLQMMRLHLMSKDSGAFKSENFYIKTIEGKNSDTYEMRLMYNETTVASSAIVNGFRNIQNLVRRLKPTTNKAGSVKSNPLAARRRVRISGKVNRDGIEQVSEPSKCDYIEIMACPSGCINGGGQISPPNDIPEKKWIAKNLLNYESIENFDLTDGNGIVVRDLLGWVENFCLSRNIGGDRLFKTLFHAVEAPTDPNAVLLGAKW